MLQMTKDFLMKAHDAFDELGYRPTDHVISFDALRNAAVKTLNHTKELEDSEYVMQMFQFLSRNYEKICSKIKKHQDFWASLKYEGNELLSLASEEETAGLYFVTNAFGFAYDKVSLCSEDFADGTLIEIPHQGGEYTCEKYSLRFSKLTSKKMVLLDENGNKVCVIGLDDDCKMVLENNNTDYAVVAYEAGMGIYKKEYLQTLGGNEPDTDKLQGFIEWDIIESKSEFGISRIDTFEDDSDLELFIFFGMSCFLLYRSILKAYRTGTAFLAFSMARRR